MLVEEWTGGKYKVEINDNRYIETGTWPKHFKNGFESKVYYRSIFLFFFFSI